MKRKKRGKKTDTNKVES